MAETKYSIHAGDPKIYVHIPDGKNVTIDDSTKGTVKVTIPAGTYMKATDSFGYNYCAFVQIEVIKSDGTKKFIPNLSKGFIEQVTYFASSGYNALSTFKEVLAPYVFLFRVGYENEHWEDYPTLKENRTKTFTIDSDAESYTVYFCGLTVNTSTWTNNGDNDSNSLRYSNYTWVTEDRNTDTDVWSDGHGRYVPGGGGNACPCDDHKSKVDSEALLTKTLVVKPISTNVRILASADKITGLFDTVVDYSGTGGFTPTVATDNKNNSFSATIRPFKKGINNNIAQVRGVIQFYKSNIPTGDYVQMPVGKRIYIGTRTPLEFVPGGMFDENGKPVLDENGKQIYYKILEDHEYSEIHGVGAYKLVNGKYESISPSFNSNTGKELPYIIPEQPAVYRRVLNSIYPKTIVFDSWAANTHDFNIEPWLTRTNNNTAKDLTLTWPLAVTPITCNKGKENEYVQLCGTSAVWIDFFAKATTFTKDGLETINGYDYIRLDNFENPDFYEDKNYSFEYFLRNRVYSKGKDTNGNVIMIPSNRPPYSYDYEDGQVIVGPPKVADIITVVKDGKETQVAFDKTKYYYMTNRSSMGSDIRKSYWLNTGFYSYPRAPRELWYESTHKDKTYVSDKSKVDKVPGENRSYKENLRPRLKDTFIWRWDKAFGDIYDADEPSNYRIFIYKKTSENDSTKVAIDAAKETSEGKLVVNTALVNGTNITRNTTAAGTPCFEVTDKYIILNLKELGFKSGDYCGCRVYSFIVRGDGSRVFSNSDIAESYQGLSKEPDEYTVRSSATAFKKSAEVNVSEITIDNDDYSLYGEGGYSSQGYDPDKSFAEGGCPSIDPQYDFIEADPGCELRSGATVWVKISDTNTPEVDWVEGTPWVKTNEGWKEADSLYVKTENGATGWKESD